MAGVLAALQAIDLGSLELNLEIADGSVSAEGSASLGDLDPRALLGELGDVLESLSDLPSDPDELLGAVKAGLTELDGLVQLPHLPVLGEVAEGLERAVAVLRQFVNRLGLQSGELDFGAVLGEVGSLEELIEDLVERLLDTLVPEASAEIRGALDTFQALSGGLPEDAGQLAASLSSLVLGLDLETLRSPCVRLDSFLGEIGSCGGDLEPIRLEMEQLAAEVRLTAGLLLEAEVDVDDVVVRLGQIQARLDLLVGASVPDATARLSADLDAIDPTSLAGDLLVALDPLIASSRDLPFDFETDFLHRFRAMADHIEALTPESLTAHFDSLREDLEGFMEGSGIELLPGGIDEMFDLLVGLLQDIPLRRLRAQLIDALNLIEAKIRGFAGFQGIPGMAAGIRDLERQLDVIDVSAVQEKVAELSDRIQQATDTFPIDDIRTELESVMQAVTDAVAQFSPALEAVGEQVDQVAQRIESIDLSPAGQASIELMGEIRANVESTFESDDVPEPAKLAIAGAATALGQIDFSVEISAPFDEALSRVDLSGVFAAIDESTGKVREALEKVTPGALVARLDEPFDALLGELEKLQPAALVAGLSQEFSAVVDLVDRLDPRELVEPLEAQFQKLVTALREAADPSPLFAPLETAYRRLQELFDVLDPEKLFGMVLGKVASLPTGVGDRLQASLASGAEGLVEAGTGGQFRLGDLLRPLAAVVHQLRSAVDKIAGEVRAEAFGLIAGPISDLRNASRVGGGMALRIADAVEQRVAMVDLLAAQGPAAELRSALLELEASAAGASLSAGARVEVDAAVAPVRLEVHVDAAAERRGELDQRAGVLRGGAATPALSGAFRRLRKQGTGLLPEVFTGDEVTAPAEELLDAVFDALDPTPMAEELDALGLRIQEKLEQMVPQLVGELISIWSVLFEAIEPLTPNGLLGRVQAGSQRVRDEIAVLDPSVLEDEVRDLVDAVADGLEVYSPAHLAEQLGVLFDGLKARLEGFDPAALLGDLDPLAGVLDEFAQMRPSVVLEPLLAETDDLQAVLEQVSSIEIGASLESATESLRAQLGEILDDVEGEFQALLSYLQGLSGGGSVSASLSI